jgi:hypothetical protein
VVANSTATITQIASVVTTRIVVDSPALMMSSGTSVLLAVLIPVCARIASRTLPVSL